MFAGILFIRYLWEGQEFLSFLLLYLGFILSPYPFLNTIAKYFMFKFPMTLEI